MSIQMSVRSERRIARVTVVAILATIVLAGFALRVWNINFDRGIGSHPDERSTACFYAPSIGLPSSWGEFQDPRRSPLNPLWDRVQQTRRSFTYGHLPLYLGVGMGHLWARLAPVAAALGTPEPALEILRSAGRACDAIAVAGRFTIALLDTLTILLIFLLGRRAFSTGAGLLAAALYALTAQAVQLSHFFAMDPASTTFTVLAVLGGVMMVQEQRLRGALIAGTGAGLAIASKFSALPVLAVPVVAVLLWLTWPRQGEANGRSQLRALIALSLAFVSAGLVFAITSPYALLDWRNFVQATLVEQGQMVRGVADMPFTRQYRNTTPYVYFLRQQLQWGMGWALGSVALAGTVVMFAELVRTSWTLLRRWIQRHGSGRIPEPYELANVILWSWVIPYFGLTGAFLAKFNRYMSPMLPFLVLFGVGMLWRLWASAERRVVLEDGSEDGPLPVRRGRRWLAAALAVAALGGGLFWSAAYVNGVYGREHTWITASRWIYENVPRDSIILWELWDDPLPKSIPGEPGMDMGTTGLRNIDWSPYEEDTSDKYAILKERLRAADYVVYSSKRIYDSVDELPARYPMTNLYYDAMWDGRLGFELAEEFTSPPRLFGMVFEDRHADESWSLYDHPQVTVFRKVRDLTDAEYDALFAGAWESAIAYHRGQDSPLSPVLELLGLGSQPGSGDRGLVSAVIGLMAGDAATEAQVPGDRPDLLLDQPLAALPVVDDYRWNWAASESAWLAVLVWWVVLTLLGWAIWPMVFALLHPMRDRGYLMSRTLGWLVTGWLLWFLASTGLALNTVRTAWLVTLALAVLGGLAAWRQWASIRRFAKESAGLLLIGEALFALAFLGFVLVRMANPDLWQPWFGGEKFMEFAFLNGILRSPTFPPVDPHFAGGYINYYYFGIYLVAFLVKLTGIYAEVAFNLAIPTLFALTVVNAFAIAYTAWAGLIRKSAQALHWRDGVAAALLAPLFVALLGNLDGFGQVVRNLAERSPIQFQGALPGLQLVSALGGLIQVVRGNSSLPAYDFWGPSRVIPNTINEFPYWSFLFADLHPHLIGIPLALAFLALLLVLMLAYQPQWGRWRWHGAALLVALGFMLGTLASVNLWELPTYFGLGVLALLVGEFRALGRIRWGRVGMVAIAYLALAGFFYLPFFRTYVNVGASGIGWVRAGDDVGTWLLIWGLLGFVIGSWVVYNTTARPSRTAVPAMSTITRQEGDDQGPDSWPDVAVVPDAGPGPATGLERFIRMTIVRFDRLPRLLALHAQLVTRPTLGYMLGIALVPVTLAAAVVAAFLDRGVLALCLAALGYAFLGLWRRQRGPAAAFVSVLAVTGLAVLAGTQVIYLKDFLQGGDWYRMNTLFKFFVQVWVLWAVAAAIALPPLWSAAQGARRKHSPETEAKLDEEDAALAPAMPGSVLLRRLYPLLWQAAVVGLVIVSCAYLVWGTPARLSQRMVGWRPAFGTLDGLAYMSAGSYSWPDDSQTIELSYDADAIRWLLDNVRGNPVIVETSEVDYYRAGSTRASSLTGLSGLRGMHISEQRYGDQVAARANLHGEFWSTPDPERILQIIDELGVNLIYVGQLERLLHPEAAERLQAMAEAEQLLPVFSNDGVVIYAVPGRVAVRPDGMLVPRLPEGGSDVGRSEHGVSTGDKG